MKSTEQRSPTNQPKTESKLLAFDVQVQQALLEVALAHIPLEINARDLTTEQLWQILGFASVRQPPTQGLTDLGTAGDYAARLLAKVIWTQAVTLLSATTAHLTNFVIY